MKKDKKLWRSPVCQDAKFGNTPPTGFQLHLSEQVKGYGVNKEYPTPTAKGDTCMKTKRYAQGGHPLTLVVGVEEGVIEPPEDYAWPRKQYPTPTTQETEHPQAELTETGRRKTGNGNSHSLNLADTIRTGGVCSMIIAFLLPAQQVSVMVAVIARRRTLWQRREF